MQEMSRFCRPARVTAACPLRTIFSWWALIPLIKSAIFAAKLQLKQCEQMEYVGFPDSDPVTGINGPLTVLWKQSG